MSAEEIKVTVTDSVTEAIAVTDSNTPTDTISTAAEAAPTTTTPTTSTTTTTTSTEPTLSPDAQKLAELIAAGDKAHSLKQHAQAVDYYASACELQAKIHGAENDPRNAFVLFKYGKSLYNDAVSRSDVLGGAAVKKDETAKKAKKAEKIAEGAVGDAALKQEKKAPGGAGAKGGLFSFQGDENWDTSESEGEDGEGDGEEGEGGDGDEQKGGEDEDDDDFANAWETLDLARVLLEKQLDPTSSTTTTEQGLSTISEESPAQAPLTGEKAKEIKTILADVYDYLGEISLEAENWRQAVKDLRSSLDLKLTLYPNSSSLISEAHYKLGLALEFEAAMEGVSDDAQLQGREAAAIQMELAIGSVKSRIAAEVQQLLAADPEAAASFAKGKGKAKEITSQSIIESKEIIGELMQRIADLRAPPPADELESANPMISGLLKDILGESTKEQKDRLQQAVKSANDVSGLVRKKAKPAPEKEAAVADASGVPPAGKRKLTDLEKLDINGRVVDPDESGSKKAKVEDSLDVEEKAGGTAAVVPAQE